MKKRMMKIYGNGKNIRKKNQKIQISSKKSEKDVNLLSLEKENNENEKNRKNN